MDWTETLAQLIHRTTSDLPADVEAAMQAAITAEAAQSQASVLLQALAANTVLARRQATPLCQDTGTLTFFWRVPCGTDTSALEASAREAVALATQRGWLRRNTIETLSGRSIDTNVADGCPVCHFEQRSEVGGQRSEVGGHGTEDGTQESDLRSPTADLRSIEVWLLQKGGGCENMSGQFSLPDATLGAGRDLDGVRKCLLQGVWQAQGFGCAPGILGVCVGADRAEGYVAAKRQLLRPLSDVAAEPELAVLEQRVLAEANALGIGPMGMGGKTTLLGVKIAVRPRLPASFFVTVAYMCWACRRRGLRATDGHIEWLG